jgi:Rhodopirellula transposase DDE domain
MLAYIRGAKTTTGLRVKATLLEGEYLTSRNVTKRGLADLALRPHSVCPDWNYTFEPRCL